MTHKPLPADARLVAARFGGLSTEIRGCVILGPQSAPLAASGDGAEWAGAARELIAAADVAADGPAASAHVATEEGEVYLVRWGELTMACVTDRFTLSSLVLSDMRASLRELTASPAQTEAAA